MIWWLDSMTTNGTRETAPHGEVLEGLEYGFSLIFKQNQKSCLAVSCKQQIQTTCTTYSLSNAPIHILTEEDGITWACGFHM